MLESLTAETFRPHIGKAYRLVPAEGEAVDASLATVTDHPDADNEHRAPFSIVFVAAGPSSLEQGTFRVEGEGAEPIELFLVPLGPSDDGAGMQYQAVFG